MITEIATKILQQWAELTGIDPEAKSLNWNNYETIKHLKEAASGLEIDPSGIVTAMLAHGFYRDHIKGKHFSLSDLLDPSVEVKLLLEKTRGMKTFLDNQEVQDAIQGFKDSITRALAHYEVEVKGDFLTLLDAPVELANMRLSALRSINDLRMDQFLRGEPEKPGVNPVFMKTIYKWWNVNSLLAAALKLPSGVSLHMIGMPKAFDTFFVFVIRNGGNLYILSDVAKEVHPLYSSMTRRPDRKFSYRANQNWFPYELADVKYVEGEDDEWRVFETTSKSCDLVTYQHDARPLSAINNLEAAPTVWLSMMFSLIVKRFWGTNEQAEELSYTGEMVVNSQALLQRASSENLPVVVNSAFDLMVIDKHMISTEVATKQGIGTTYNLTTAWMEERYANQVSDDVLNITAAQDKAPGLILTSEGRVMVQADQETETGLRVTASHPYPATRFGSATALENDRKFLARTNYAKSIALLAKAEFDIREHEIRSWYGNAVTRNLSNIVALCGNEAIWVDDGENGDHETTMNKNRAAARSNGNRLFHRFMGRVEIGGENNYWPSVMLYPSHNGAQAKCNVTGAKASYLVGFTPANAQELAILAGCEVNELPDVLQHWTLRKHNTGNPISERIDPMSWRLHDPWSDISFIVTLALSKRGLAQLEKSPKLPPLTIATADQMKHASAHMRVIG